MFIGVNGKKRVLFVSGVSVREGYGGAIGVHEVSDDAVPDNPTAHVLQNGVFVPVDSEFNVEVSLVLAIVSANVDDALSVLERGYTEREIKSWPQQASEAVAYSADSAAVTPLLSEIVVRRGISLDELVQRVLDNVKTAAVLTGIVLGDEQAAMDKIKALKSLSDNDRLPDDWFEQLQSIAENWRKNWPPELLEAANS